VAIDDTGRIGVMAFAMNHRHGQLGAQDLRARSAAFRRPDHGQRSPLRPAKMALHPRWNEIRTRQLELFTATVRVAT
jgi:hypothetical protein